jgi:bla regulator protein BlaR1
LRKTDFADRSTRVHCRIPRVKLGDPIRRSNYSATLLAFCAVIPLAVAQNATPDASAAIAAKPLAFDVISIRPSKPGTNQRTQWGTTPDGYSVTGQSMWATIMIAYFPQGMAYWSKDRVSGAPPWLSDQYDIVAKVSEADLAEWQKQGLTLDKKPMFRQMLQTMLADRCHLVAHMVPGPPISGWSLEVGKHEPHLTESKPSATLPVGMKLPDGGVMLPYQRGDKPHLTFYAASMADLAQNLSMNSMGHPVQDHTRLTGHYDFVINWVSDPDSKLPEGVVDSNDPEPLSHWNIDALGLHVTPINLPVDTLVIDHIEKPSEN